MYALYAKNKQTKVEHFWSLSISHKLSCLLGHVSEGIWFRSLSRARFIFVLYSVEKFSVHGTCNIAYKILYNDAERIASEAKYRVFPVVAKI